MYTWHLVLEMMSAYYSQEADEHTYASITVYKRGHSNLSIFGSWNVFRTLSVTMESCSSSFTSCTGIQCSQHAMSGLYTGFIPRGGELGVCQKEGARLFVDAGQPQGGRCIWKFKGGENNSRKGKCPPTSP